MLPDRFKSIARKTHTFENIDLGAITIRTLTAADYIGLPAPSETDEQVNLRRCALQIARSLSNEAGERIANDEDAEAIMQWPNRVLIHLMEEIGNFNSLGKVPSPSPNAPPT